jgi:hypothetical protein
MFFEATAVEPRGRVGRFDLGLWNDAQQDSIARVVAFCRQHGHEERQGGGREAEAAEEIAAMLEGHGLSGREG